MLKLVTITFGSLLSLLFLFAEPALSQTVNGSFTQPQPPKVKPAPELRIFPGNQIPENPERYIWKVTNKIAGKEITTGPVPIYGLFSGRLSRIGTIPAGTTITLSGVRPEGRSLYYSFPWTAEGKDMNSGKAQSLKTAWISGNMLEAAGIAPPVQ